VISATQSRPVEPDQPIRTVAELQDHLYHAIQLEFSTIPLYLYALYSIQTQGYSQWSAGISALRTIRSVVIEEMLHLCLARNLMIAIGGGDSVRFYDQDLMPTYPSPMLHRLPKLMLHLAPCSVALMTDVFMPLELPARQGAPPEPGWYHTIGEFYAAVTAGFERLEGAELWAHNQPELQYLSGYWNQDGGGSPLVVCDLPSARQAIVTIVEQGEGSDPGTVTVPLDPVAPQAGMTELSHYGKFQQIATGIDQIGNVWPVPVDPSPLEWHGPVGQLAGLFDAAYCYVLCLLDALYGASRMTELPGQRSTRYRLERSFIAAMGGILFPIANLLVGQNTAEGKHAAPTFSYYPFGADRPKRDQLQILCGQVAAHYPTLGGDDSVLHLIGLLPSV
jgi:hypothetical protein